MRRRYREWRRRRRQRQEDPGRAILPPHERQQGDRLSDQIEAMRLRNALRRRDPIEESEEDFDEGAEEEEDESEDSVDDYGDHDDDDDDYDDDDYADDDDESYDDLESGEELVMGETILGRLGPHHRRGGSGVNLLPPPESFHNGLDEFQQQHLSTASSGRSQQNRVAQNDLDDLELSGNEDTSGAEVGGTTVEIQRDSHSSREGEEVDADSGEAFKGTVSANIGEGEDEDTDKDKDKDHERFDNSQGGSRALGPRLDLNEAFKRCGREVGLEVWRLDREERIPRIYQYVRVPKNLQGKFFRGQCYLILYTYSDVTANKLSHKIHCLYGDAPSGAKAALSLQAKMLADRLGCNQKDPKVEWEGSESEGFLEYFERNGIKYMEGEHDMEYNQSDPISLKGYTKLFRLETRQKTMCFEEIEAEVESIEEPEYMCILDLGTVLHVWDGGSVPPHDRNSAKAAAKKIATERAHLDRCDVRYKTNSLFWVALGAKLLQDKTIAVIRQPSPAERVLTNLESRSRR